MTTREKKKPGAETQDAGRPVEISVAGAGGRLGWSAGTKTTSKRIQRRGKESWP